MKIKTAELLNITNIVYKGVTNNKIIPLTQMIGIKAENGVLFISATDMTNYITGRLNIEDKEANIDVCVNADMFSKLINKFTTEYVEINLSNNSIMVCGDGDYNLEILLNEDGQEFKFPAKLFNNELPSKVEIKVADIVEVKKHNEKSLATTMENPSLINYYVGSDIITTDTLVMTVTEKELLEEPLILKSKFIDLLTNLREKITLTCSEDKIYATDGTFDLLSVKGCDLEDYPTNEITHLIKSADFATRTKINVNKLLAVLDRLALFVTPYDQNVINLKFDNNKLFLSTLKSKGVEIIELKLIDGEEFKPFMCALDIDMLKTQLGSFDKEEIELSYGNDNFIKLGSDLVSKLISTVENN